MCISITGLVLNFIQGGIKKVLKCLTFILFISVDTLYSKMLDNTS